MAFEGLSEKLSATLFLVFLKRAAAPCCIASLGLCPFKAAQSKIGGIGLAFEGLSEKLSATFKKLRGRGKLSEADVREAMREVRMALLEADVNYRVAKDFVERVTTSAIGENITASMTPAQQVIKIVNDELTTMMGERNEVLKTSTRYPNIFLMCGLQGSGKTTHSAKLAKMLRSQGKRPMLTACDVYRPAAIEQLKVMGQRANAYVFEQGTGNPVEIARASQGKRPMLTACDVYRPAAIEQLKVMGQRANAYVFEQGTGNPVEIARASIAYAKDYGYDTVIIDTAGRLSIDQALMQELKDIKEAVQPDDILLVLDSMTGQDAVTTAEAFDRELSIGGIIMTKLDGDTRGGAALSVRAVTGKPIKFIGAGEKLDDLEPFHPDRMASRILGMGDILSLIERAEGELDRQEAEKLAKKMSSNDFNFNDLLAQLQQVRKLGSMRRLLDLLPGGSKVSDEDLADSEKNLKRTEAIIFSMTPFEREHPSKIDPKRKRRIAAGSGTKVEDVNRLLKQLEQTKKLMKTMGKRAKEHPSKIDPKRKRRIAAGSGTKVEDVNRLLKQLEQTKKLMKTMGKRAKKGMLGGFGGMGFPPGM